MIANTSVGGDGRDLCMWLFPFNLVSDAVAGPVKPALETFDSGITAQPRVTSFTEFANATLANSGENLMKTGSVTRGRWHSVSPDSIEVRTCAARNVPALFYFEVVINAVRKAAPGAAMPSIHARTIAAMLLPDRWRRKPGGVVRRPTKLKAAQAQVNRRISHA